MTAMPDPALVPNTSSVRLMPLRRILFVTRTFPSGFELSVNGVYQRMRLFLEAAMAVSARLDILFFVEPEFLSRLDPDEFADELLAHWSVRANVYFAARRSHERGWLKANVEPLWNVRAHEEVFKTGDEMQARAVAARIADRDAGPLDLIFAFQFESALPVVAQAGPCPPWAMDLNDVEHIKYPRMLARPPHSLRKRLKYAYWPALYLGERTAVRRSATTFVCSETQAVRLKPMAGAACIRVAPNAVKVPRVADEALPRRDERYAETLLFVGIYAYPPNLEAAEFLVNDILPLVLESLPRARLVFVGSYIDRIAHLASSPNVIMRGFVDDIATAYREAAVSCSPILAGGGTRTKIIEAVAFRLPVVATTLGAEGLEFEDETEIVRRDDAASFAAACVDLIRDPAKAAAIAQRAYQRVRMYDRERVIEQIAADLVTASTRA